MIVFRKKIPLTLNKGFPTSAWFDLASLSENVLEDESSIMRAVDKVHDFLDEEISSSKVSSVKTILAGFSQGGALAMYAALTYHKRLAGVVVMSSWPVLRHTMPAVSEFYLHLNRSEWKRKSYYLPQRSENLKTGRSVAFFKIFRLAIRLSSWMSSKRINMHIVKVKTIDIFIFGFH